MRHGFLRVAKGGQYGMQPGSMTAMANGPPSEGMMRPPGPLGGPPGMPGAPGYGPQQAAAGMQQMSLGAPPGPPVSTAANTSTTALHVTSKHSKLSRQSGT